eukprot:3179170-Rhodomonas_salina.1
MPGTDPAPLGSRYEMPGTDWRTERYRPMNVRYWPGEGEAPPWDILSLGTSDLSLPPSSPSPSSSSSLPPDAAFAAAGQEKGRREEEDEKLEEEEAEEEREKGMKWVVKPRALEGPW